MKNIRKDQNELTNDIKNIMNNIEREYHKRPSKIFIRGI